MVEYAPDFLAFVMGVSLVLYALGAGADFGGGVWDLFARGPRAQIQRKLIEKAIAPIWEANHVWLILVVVVLFSAFPPAFARISIFLHVPLLLLLFGIVLRGAAFVFRQYGVGAVDSEHWGRVFAIASVLTPLCLGTIIGAITTGAGTTPTQGTLNLLNFAWCTPFSLSVGFFALAQFSFLAAVYLVNETDDAELQNDFRKRAALAGASVACSAIVSGWLIPREAAHFSMRLGSRAWSVPLLLATSAVFFAVYVNLWRKNYRMARVFVVAQTVLVLLGWGLAHYPFLVAPDITIQSARAPDALLRLLVPILILGSLVLFPSLFWMLRIFKKGAGANEGRV